MHHRNNHITSILATKILSVVYAVVLAIAPVRHAMGQTMPVDGLKILDYSSSSMTIAYDNDFYQALPCGNGYFLLTSPYANSFSTLPGKPMLPQARLTASVRALNNITVITADERWHKMSISDLKGHESCRGLMMEPAHSARPKSQEPERSIIDTSCYTNGNYYTLPLVEAIPLGTMRNDHLAQIVVSPVRYNAANDSIWICSHFVATIGFGADTATSERPYNPMTAGLDILHPSRATGAKGYSNLFDGSDSPYSYVIVSPQKYRNGLQPLTSWKRQEGYIVDEHYCDGETKDQIRDYLKQRFDSADADNPAPLHILLVGDVSDVPIWIGERRVSGLEVHRTDLPYAEYTGDGIPDALIGRLSVSDTVELRHAVEKTVAYERGLFRDSSHLQRCLLVAGRELTAPAPTATNGQVNYLKSRLTALDPTIDTLCYYNPSSDSLADEIKGRFTEGIGLVSYTSHCQSFGWTHPDINNDFADTLPHEGQTFLAVNNCCRSNNVSGNCFGEHLIRVENGGAIGAIGASNETLWDEDYYWSVGGNAPLTLMPQYDSTLPGAYDRLPQVSPLPDSAMVITQGQLVVAGNWAVMSTGSPYSLFYWEIYSLIGDPSLMPYIGIPSRMPLDFDSIAMGDTVIAVHTLPYARVAATWNDSLFGICTGDSSGEATMRLLKPFHGNIRLTATAPRHTPIQKMVVMRPEDTMTVKTVTIRNGDSYRIYPNPAHNRFTIDGIDAPASIAIVDASGRTVEILNADKGETVEVDTATYPKGLYTIVITTGQEPSAKGKTIKKIVIQ